MSKTKPKYKDEEWLREQYWGKGKSSTEIAEFCNVSSTTIIDWMKNLDIDRRSSGKTNAIKQNKGKKYNDKQWLKKQYWENKKNLREIAEELDVHPETIRRAMKKQNIDRRTSKENQPLRAKGRKYSNEDWLREQYLEQDKTVPEILELCDINSKQTVYNWLEKFNIKIRDRGEATKLGHDHGEKYKKEKWLREQYWEERKDTTEIAAECSISSSVIYKYLKRFGIKTRDKSEALSMKLKPNAKYRNEKWLEKQYIKKGRTTTEIAKECNTDSSVISKWLRKFNIETKNSTMSGSQNGNSKGGQTIKDGKKKCSKCGKWFPLYKFDSASRMSTGLSSTCKICSREMEMRLHRKKMKNPKYRLNINISRSMAKALKGNKNGYHWENLVPYNLDNLKEHLENQFEDDMTWENYGDWHIDHIIPRSHFDYESPEDEEFQECWALENLQPLWAEENLKKSDKLNWDK